ncbi:MAG TPA: PVC-type heme-binding CxxCH protein [Humisphaera sp.]|jgi:glucose/arabinose dehydrogenase|nr:PVC-type heme-binding CxxCH protein [Humisphaera sp.]
MPHYRLRLAAVISAFIAGAAGLSFAADSDSHLTLDKGNQVSLIGGGLADRMQHYGWLETLIESRFPDRDITIRNLGFAGDEIDLKNRMRSKNFGTPDEWLTRTKSDVVLMFFGYNESYGSAAGLPKFKRDLDAVIKQMLEQKYNGASAPKLVLISSIAQENLHNPNLPDAAAHNKNIKLYTEAMAQVAKDNNVLFVDLFAPSLEIYSTARSPLTVDGIHLNEEGDHAIAAIIDKALFGDRPSSAPDSASLEKLRSAVLDKNFYWFNRYRTMDGYNVYGDRADVKYANQQTNRVVMDREMEILDIKTANRDKRVWAVASGKDLKVTDDNLPPLVPVKTNKPGPLAGGTYPFLSGEEAIKHMTVAQGFKVNLFASEEQWPELEKPVQMSFDDKGRLWVAVWPSYPHWQPEEEMNDKLLVFEDTKGTGKADKMTVFADHLHCPTGFAFYNGGVLLAQAPGLIYLKDSKGTGHADVRERVLEGLDSADSHHTANSFVYDPGGALYFQEGTFFRTQVETAWGPPERSADGAVYRFEPRTFKFETYAGYPFANPHGHVFDHWGTDIVTDGTGAVPYYGPSFTGKVYFPQKHRGAPTVYKQRTRPCPGTEIVSSSNFPDEYQGHFFVANVITVQGILNYKLDEKGSGVVGTEVRPPFLQSNDPNFRPSAMEFGPDGGLYVLDWQNPLIGHLQHALRDPNRDHTHGRIYRIVYTERPLAKPAQIAGASIEQLLDLLKSPIDRVRYHARIELGTHDAKDVTSAIDKWIAALDKNDPEYQHHMMEGLWAYQWQNVVNEPLLKQMLKSPDYHARAAATRVLCYWRDRVDKPLDLLRTMVTDDSPRVRLEAVRSCSFFTSGDAGNIALQCLNKPMDPFLEYTLKETSNTLDRFAQVK